MRTAHPTAAHVMSAMASAFSGTRARFGLIVALAASIDLLTKALATGILRDGAPVILSERLAFMLVYNTGGAGGLMIGPYTWAINAIVTIAAIAMVARIVTPLAAFDARSTRALGLVAGGAFGNLASMMTGPEGVADFLALALNDSITIVMNGADLLLWGGTLMLSPVVVRLVGAVRAERSARQASNG